MIDVLVAGMAVAGAVRPRAELVQVTTLEERLGSLLVIADFSRRLDIAGIIDALCPRGPAALGHEAPTRVATRTIRHPLGTPPGSRDAGPAARSHSDAVGQ
nr:hypothetical protein Ade03nite_03720 [Actinoplanes derwentensis]